MMMIMIIIIITYSDVGQNINNIPTLLHSHRNTTNKTNKQTNKQTKTPKTNKSSDGLQQTNKKTTNRIKA